MQFAACQRIQALQRLGRTKKKVLTRERWKTTFSLVARNCCPSPVGSEATSHLRLAVPTKDVCGCVQCLAGENGYTGVYQHNGQKSSGPAAWHYLQSIITRSFESQMTWSQMTARLQQRRDSEGCMQTLAQRRNAIPHCRFAMGESAPGNLKIPVRTRFCISQQCVLFAALPVEPSVLHQKESCLLSGDCGTAIPDP